MSFRRMLPLILINVVVSAVVVLAILYWWDGRRPEETETTDVAAVTLTPPLAATGAAAALPGTETAEPEEGPLVHVVQAGDTLGNISQFYEVSLDDIMAVNNLTDPNLLAVGQQLVIPVGGLPTATAPAATEAATAVTTTVAAVAPVATEPLVLGEAVIEILEVIGAGQLTEEAVQIINSGSSPVALHDWQVVDEDGHVYTFGQVTLFGDGAGVLVHTETGQDNSTDLYWGLEEPVWEAGEVVTLLDAEGEIQATLAVP